MRARKVVPLVDYRLFVVLTPPAGSDSGKEGKSACYDCIFATHVQCSLGLGAAVTTATVTAHATRSPQAATRRQLK